MVGTSSGKSWLLDNGNDDDEGNGDKRGILDVPGADGGVYFTEVFEDTDFS